MEALLSLSRAIEGLPYEVVLGVIVIGLPLVAAGLIVRAMGRRRAARVARAAEARRALADVGPGAVTVSGRFRLVPDQPAWGSVESPEGARVLLALESVPEVPADGAEVLVSGWATRRVENPFPAGYREAARVWVVEPELVSTDLAVLDRGAARARRLGHIGGALFAVGIVAGLTTAIVTHRAAARFPLTSDIDDDQVEDPASGERWQSR